MKRRHLLKMIGSGALAGAMVNHKLTAQDQAERAMRGVKPPRIKDVPAIATAPEGLRLTVVKVTTDQDGLDG